MRILSIKIDKLKSIQCEHDELTFYNKETSIPMHTVIVGENGIGKSTFLEALTLPSQVCIMRDTEICKEPDNLDDLAVVKIKIMLSDGTPDVKGNIRNDGTTGTIFFYHEIEEAAFITDHLADDEKIKKWRWFIEPNANNYKTFRDGLLEQAEFNRPPMSVEDGTNLKEALEKNRETKRSQLLHEWDNIRTNECKNLLKRQLELNGNIYYINTDQNTYGAGNHILESAKNISADLAKILHHRLPATIQRKISDTDENGDKTYWDGELRNLGEINKAWQSIFGKPLDVSKNNKKMQRSILSVRCKDDGKTKFVMTNFNGKPYQPRYLSSGENEAFFVLATIISCKLHNCVLLLDEPELHMHFNQQVAYYECLREIFKDYGIQAVIISHSHFIADKIFTDPAVKSVSTAMDDRENLAQIRHLIARNEKILISSNRTLTAHSVRNDAEIYMLGYFGLEIESESREKIIREITNEFMTMDENELGKLKTFIQTNWRH